MWFRKSTSLQVYSKNYSRDVSKEIPKQNLLFDFLLLDF